MEGKGLQEFHRRLCASQCSGVHLHLMLVRTFAHKKSKIAQAGMLVINHTR